MNQRSKDILILFDVDGTLTKPRNLIVQQMEDTITKLQNKHYVGIVGGSDLNKIKEQLGSQLTLRFDYTFSENGLLGLKNGVEFHRKSLSQHLGEENLQRFINFTLAQLSLIMLPLKRGNFIEFRSGMLNISPVGRNCSQQEREDFETYDHKHQVRRGLIDRLQAEFPTLQLKYSIGGQISFDVFPEGWDKTYCLQFVEEFKEIHFFGDRTSEGGNDYEIYSHPRTIGHSVQNFEETIEQVERLFLCN